MGGGWLGVQWGDRGGVKEGKCRGRKGVGGRNKLWQRIDIPSFGQKGGSLGKLQPCSWKLRAPCARRTHFGWKTRVTAK